MKKIVLLAALVLIASGAQAQLAVTSHGVKSLPEGVVRPGFYVQKTVVAQLDDDPQMEEVLLIGCDNGHWPEFDLFRQYVAVIDGYTREVEYMSKHIVVTDSFNMEVEDRDCDGKAEVYYEYIRPGSFDVDDFGYYMSAERLSDRISMGEGVDADMLAAAAGDRRQADSLRLLPSRNPYILNPSPAPSPEGGPIKVMMIAGQDGSHWWRGACEAMKQILENTRKFKVDFCFTPGWDGDMKTFDPDFSGYDLVVINYGGNEWSDRTKARFEKFVADGGGAVFLHSSIIPHENWPAWNEMTGLGAWNMRKEDCGPRVYMLDGNVVYDYTPGWAGYHGLQHLTTVDTQAPGHPVMQDLPSSWRHYKDEIYLELRGPAHNLEILATTHDRDKDFPVMWTTRYGKGRVFVDVQGHCGSDPQMVYSMTCTGFQVTFARGCEWAATGKVSIPVPADFPTAAYYTLRPDFKDNTSER